MKHIIIEGPDGAGKTTLARFLCHRHNMGYHHEGPPPVGVSALEHYGRLLAEAPRPTVFDRLHLGEVVYGPLLRGGSRLSTYDWGLMNRLIRGTGSVVVTCLAPWATCITNNRAKEELIKDEGLLRVAYDTWSLVISHDLMVNHQFYDYTSSPPFKLLETDTCPDGVVGSPDATVLLVGEQPNGALDLPFFSAANSSAFLNGALQAAGYGLTEWDVAFTNAITAKGVVRDLAYIVSQMPRLKVAVGLGRTAHNQLERQRVPFVKVEHVPHPAYWKRFHASEPSAYITQLQKVRDAA